MDEGVVELWPVVLEGTVVAVVDLDVEAPVVAEADEAAEEEVVRCELEKEVEDKVEPLNATVPSDITETVLAYALVTKTSPVAGS